MLHRVLPCLVALLALTFLVGAPILAGEKDKKETHEGLVVKAGGGKLTMTDMEGKKEHTHLVPKTAKILDVEGKECKLEDFVKGQPILVITEGAGERAVVVRIEAKKKKNSE